MTRWATRITLVVTILLIGIVMVEKDSTNIGLQTRTSRYRDTDSPKVSHTHVGYLKDHRLAPATTARNTPLSWLNFDKKINTYYFTFYNWYFF
jgi:hypothetical protein